MSATLYRRFADVHRPGDRFGRLWVRLTLSQAQVDQPSSLLSRPGDYLFTGMWYGDDPLDPDSYGKVVPLGGAVPVGRVSRRSGFATLRRLGHPGAAASAEGRR